MSDDAVKIEEVPEPHMEWKMPGDLYYIVADHGSWIQFPNDSDIYCEYCYADPRHVPLCERDITRAYRNFLANMTLVIIAAAAEQRGYERRDREQR